jgi:hypothetical protein
MPWTPNDAERHTRMAATWALKELWAKVANECLERTGDERPDSARPRDQSVISSPMLQGRDPHGRSHDNLIARLWASPLVARARHPSAPVTAPE